MKQQGRATDGAGYAPTVRRRKLLTAMIFRAAEISRLRRWAQLSARAAAPIGATSEEFQAYVAWEEAWVNAIKEERVRICKTPAKQLSKEPWRNRPKYFRAVSQQKRSRSGATP